MSTTVLQVHAKSQVSKKKKNLSILMEYEPLAVSLPLNNEKGTRQVGGAYKARASKKYIFR